MWPPCFILPNKESAALIFPLKHLLIIIFVKNTLETKGSWFRVQFASDECVCTKWWKLHYSQKFSVVLHSLTHLTSKQKSCVRSLNPANFHSNTTSPLLLNATFSSVPKNYQGMLFPCRKSHSFTDVWHKSFFKRVLRTLFFPISSKWVVD